MRTHAEIMDVMRDYMTSEDIIEATGIDAGELAECLADWVEVNIEQTNRGLEELGFEQGGEDEG